VADNQNGRPGPRFAHDSDGVREIIPEMTDSDVRRIVTAAVMSNVEGENRVSRFEKRPGHIEHRSAVPGPTVNEQYHRTVRGGVGRLDPLPSQRDSVECRELDRLVRDPEVRTGHLKGALRWTCGELREAIQGENAAGCSGYGPDDRHPLRLPVGSRDMPGPSSRATGKIRLPGGSWQGVAGRAEKVAQLTDSRCGPEVIDRFVDPDPERKVKTLYMFYGVTFIFI
jgi:hypothetical protein